MDMLKKQKEQLEKGGGLVEPTESKFTSRANGGILRGDCFVWSGKGEESKFM